jgi:hypothetical protein
MIHHLDQSIEQHFRVVVPLPTAIDVSFATPDKRWGAARTKPTINFFLWDVRKDDRSAQSGYTEERLPNGELHRHVPNPEIALRFLVTAWAGEPRDEHQLLGAVLRGALLHSHLEPTSVVPDLPAVGPVLVGVSTGDGRPNDFWNSLDGQLKPNLELTVRMFVDLGQELPVGPGIDGVDVSFDRLSPTPPAPTGRAAAVGEGKALPRRRRGNAIVTGPAPADDEPTS